MGGMQKLPDDSPIMIAWEKYRKTDDYRNSLKWALGGDETIPGDDQRRRWAEGSLWSAFLEGWVRMAEALRLRVDEVTP